MALKTEYYAVTVAADMASQEMLVGCYQDKGLAEKVAGLLVAVLFPEKPFIPYVREGIGETKEACIFKLSNLEVDRIFETATRLLGIESLDKEVPPTTVDTPKEIVTREHHCAVIEFIPYDGSRKFTLGYYQSRHTVEKVCDVIRLIHENAGGGFRLGSEHYTGDLVEYESGKLYIKVGEEMHEVKTSCRRDVPKISRAVFDAILKCSDKN